MSEIHSDKVVRLILFSHKFSALETMVNVWGFYKMLDFQSNGTVLIGGILKILTVKMLIMPVS